MKQILYEIWMHDGSQTWKVFTNVSNEQRRLLIETGWRLADQYDEDETKLNMERKK